MMLQMTDSNRLVNLSLKLGETLSKIDHLDSPQLYTFYVNDIYKRPPSFSFRFHLNDKGKYNELSKIIESFCGNLNWFMYKEGGKINYTIEPKVFFDARKLIAQGQAATIDKILTHSVYSRVCDHVLEDIEPLCDHILKSLNIPHQ